MTTANHDQLGSRCKAHIDQATRTAHCCRWPANLMLRCGSSDRTFAATA